MVFRPCHGAPIQVIFAQPQVWATAAPNARGVALHRMHFLSAALRAIEQQQIHMLCCRCPKMKAPFVVAQEAIPTVPAPRQVGCTRAVNVSQSSQEDNDKHRIDDTAYGRLKPSWR